jgi:hypothetical protein
MCWRICSANSASEHREQRPVRWPTETRSSLATRSGHQSACRAPLTARKCFQPGKAPAADVARTSIVAKAKRSEEVDRKAKTNRHPSWRAPGSRAVHRDFRP